MEGTRILGVQVRERSESIAELQDILTRYGCSIRTRLGLHHDEGPDEGSHNLILLELTGDPDEADRLEASLNELPGVITGRMDFPAVAKAIPH